MKKQTNNILIKQPVTSQDTKNSFGLSNTPPGLDAKDDENDITAEERALLDKAGEDDEERELHGAELDSTDEDGEPLNELSSSNAKGGTDLDVPGSEDDDDNENIGEEDEENNSYSLGSDRYD